MEYRALVSLWSRSQGITIDPGEIVPALTEEADIEALLAVNAIEPVVPGIKLVPEPEDEITEE